ncbi:hypothetical protein Btru_002337 [Bulinus truncatus]|nr:hypothetical protein Btru_002337 [Bulinus truncatus]
MAKYKLSPKKPSSKKDNVQNKSSRPKFSHSSSEKNRSSNVNSRLSTVKTRRISQAQTSKWKTIQRDFLNFVLSLLEEALTRYSKSGNKEVLRIHKKIRTTFLREIKSIKMPAEKLTDIKAIKSTEVALLAEKNRLDKLEAKLNTTLKKEERLNKQLQSEVSKFDSTSVNHDEQLHSILQNCI